MGFIAVPDRAAGYALAETDWDASIKDNFNTGTWAKLADTILVAPAASIDLISISAAFSHLYLVAWVRGTNASLNETVSVRFNNDTGANYDHQRLRGAAAAATAAEAFANSRIDLEDHPNATAPANVFGTIRAFIPNYANTTNHKALISRHASKFGTSGGGLRTGIQAGFWRSAVAINRITLFQIAVGNLDTGSRVSLYGLA